MRATFTEEQRIVAETIERMAKGGVDAAHRVLHGGDWPSDPDADLIRDWSGLGVPEADGGAGGGLLELALVVRELARGLMPNRFTAHVMALQAGLGAGLPLAAALENGERWCLAVGEVAAGPFGPFYGRLKSGGIHARKIGVPHAQGADRVAVLLDKDRLAIVCPDRLEPVPVFDPLNPAADLEFEGGKPSAVGSGARGGLLRACALLAADLCGTASGAIELGAEHARNRVQFGKPIGAFQAVAHQLADALVAAETAWSLTLYACWALDNGTRDAAKAVHAAKARAADAALFAAERTLQVHGGMGMTWEAAPHLYLRHAQAGSAWLGGPGWHRRRVGIALLDRFRNDGNSYEPSLEPH